MNKDIVSNALNQMMNAIKAKKRTVTIKAHSNLLLSVLAIAKLKGYVKNYKVNEDNTLTVEIGKLHGCRAIKPRYVVGVDEIEKYSIRYLPAKEIGTIIISTNKGLMTHHTAQEKHIGGSLIAYIY